MMEIDSLIQSSDVASPEAVPDMIARINRTAVSVRIVPPYGNGDRVILGNTQTVDNGISDQRMRCEHAGDQQTCVEAVIQKIITDRKTDYNGKEKSKESKDQTFVFMLVELIHVELEPGNKHDIQQSYCREQIDC